MATLRSDKEASSLLSTYLLQGWVMSDEICGKNSCSYPLMRSKDGSLSFCTLHDVLPNQGANHHYPLVNKQQQESQQQKEQQLQQQREQQREPQTPVIDDGSEELRIRRERREQSSKASQLIGQKMLQRWALLNEQCPNETCYAIPLIRNPETKKMFCVICENYILTEEEALKLEQEKASKAIKPVEKSVEKPIEKPVEKVKEFKAPARKEEDYKRQKVEQKSSPSANDLYSSDDVISTLSEKMNELSDRVKASRDPKELSDLFKSIKQCANAIKACVEAGDAYDRKFY